ncbi:hypothetical protein PW5551_03475 [Petrotoga sp. 9PW.55.5.1]|uniref:hypothetical protein n=1 Tax=Petrotoga sp. 9PW.55.5.1 TaxID=1308979 RepID=UPI000DC3C19F|nr:hypothetical protein [Petrotoga sp. 9PW.55.5.1]RAO99547.1 hypothetical protein PW5551_03475 [Petrotoga sp. 9PW.55.5.1]
MSIQRILNVISEKDYKAHSRKTRALIEKANGIIRKPRELNPRKMFWIYRVLGRDAELKISKKHINDFQFLIMHILRKPKENRFEDLKRYYKLNQEAIDNLKFLIFPNKFPPGGYNEKLKKYGVEFYNEQVILKRLNFKDFIDLYSLITYIPLDVKTPFVQNLLDEILSIDPLETKLSLYKKIKDIFKSLGQYEKQMVEVQLKNISYYHFRLMNLNSRKGVVIDGSNVVRYNDLNNMNIFLDLLDNLYIENLVFFPAVIVFDKNIDYILKSEEDKNILRRLIEKKRVYLESPADKLIVYFSNKFGYYMISQDKFQEYKFDKEKLLELRRFIDE